ncbi:hypothetical protein ACTVYL_28950 [Pseudomonas aeruginosa]
MYQNFITTLAVLITALALAAQLNWIEPRPKIEAEPWPPATQLQV